MRTLAGWCPVDLPGRNSLDPPICFLAVGPEEFSYQPLDALVELWALLLGQPLPDFIAVHRRALGDPQKSPWGPRSLETVRREVEALLTEKRPIRGTPDDVERELLQLCEEHPILRERWQQYYDKWHALPQIFISR